MRGLATLQLFTKSHSCSLCRTIYSSYKICPCNIQYTGILGKLKHYKLTGIMSIFTYFERKNPANDAHFFPELVGYYNTNIPLSESKFKHHKIDFDPHNSFGSILHLFGCNIKKSYETLLNFSCQ